MHACELQIKNFFGLTDSQLPLLKPYREVVPIVVGLNCQLQQVLRVVVEGVALSEVAGTTRYQQTVDSVKPVASHLVQH